MSKFVILGLSASFFVFGASLGYAYGKQGRDETFDAAQRCLDLVRKANDMTEKAITIAKRCESIP